MLFCWPETDGIDPVLRHNPQGLIGWSIARGWSKMERLTCERTRNTCMTDARVGKKDCEENCKVVRSLELCSAHGARRPIGVTFQATKTFFCAGRSRAMSRHVLYRDRNTSCTENEEKQYSRRISEQWISVIDRDRQNDIKTLF